MYDISEIATLIRKKLEGTISTQELLLLDDWAKKSEANSELLKKSTNEKLLFEDVVRWLELTKEEEEGTWARNLERRTFSKIHETVEEQVNNASRKPVYLQVLPYAAAVLLLFGVGLMYFHTGLFEDKAVVVSDLEPGSNRAFVTLSDGKVIELSDQQEGIVLGDELTYTDGSVISDLNESAVVYAELKTPRGGQYQVTLSDGTKVWLNADSKLIYPSRFEGDVREVQLDGEAYFEVASSTIGTKKQRFVVKTAHQEVEVLGTAFNVMAYAEDVEEATTLIEGSVKLYSGTGEVLLSPGDQGLVSESQLNKRKVDIDQYLAWKNNEFIFHETELADAMKMLSRWYDFEVVYEGNMPATHFYGSISREKALSEVLKIMESSGLKFRIEKSGNRNKLTVLK